MDIKWNQKELEGVVLRILNLSDQQIIKLIGQVGISFKTPMKQLIAEIREAKWSIPMDVLTSEANSKKNLLKRIKIFEKENQSKK